MTTKVILLQSTLTFPQCAVHSFYRSSTKNFVWSVACIGVQHNETCIIPLCLTLAVVHVPVSQYCQCHIVQVLQCAIVTMCCQWHIHNVPCQCHCVQVAHLCNVTLAYCDTGTLWHQHKVILAHCDINTDIVPVSRVMCQCCNVPVSRCVSGTLCQLLLVADRSCLVVAMSICCVYAVCVCGGGGVSLVHFSCNY